MLNLAATTDMFLEMCSLKLGKPDTLTYKQRYKQITVT